MRWDTRLPSTRAPHWATVSKGRGVAARFRTIKFHIILGISTTLSKKFNGHRRGQFQKIKRDRLTCWGFTHSKHGKHCLDAPIDSWALYYYWQIFEIYAIWFKEGLQEHRLPSKVKMTLDFMWISLTLDKDRSKVLISTHIICFT